VQVEGVLTGFDPFMNLVLDNAVEITKQVKEVINIFNSALAIFSHNPRFSHFTLVLLHSKSWYVGIVNVVHTATRKDKVFSA
jgi:hypothetical protein